MPALFIVASGIALEKSVDSIVCIFCFHCKLLKVLEKSFGSDLDFLCYWLTCDSFEKDRGCLRVT